MILLFKLSQNEYMKINISRRRVHSEVSLHAIKTRLIEIQIQLLLKKAHYFATTTEHG